MLEANSDVARASRPRQGGGVPGIRSTDSMITIGTRFYPAAADGERRQQLARDALLALPDVHRVNLQFTDETYRPEGFETRAVLRSDSRTVTGGGRVRKPIVREMFDALAAAAAAR